MSSKTHSSAPNDGDEFQVLACAPTFWDILQYFRPDTKSCVPGGSIVVREPNKKQIMIVGPFAPCNACSACNTSLHLACNSPIRPGINHPGGFSKTIRIESKYLVPDIPMSIDPAAIAAFISLAGTTYQTAASVGFVPGDTVIVFGNVGPGAFPLQLLNALGMFPAWVTSSPTPSILGNITHLSSTPDIGEIKNQRFHIIDLYPTDISCAQWLPLAHMSLSCTFVGPSLPFPNIVNTALQANSFPPLNQLLAGQTALRWIKDIHPHLLLELIALIEKKWVDIEPWIYHVTIEQMPKAFDVLLKNPLESSQWPVLVNPWD